jgi:large repetitive protein
MTAPTASPSQSPAANAAGWNNSEVTVDFACADAPGGSGLDVNSVFGAVVSTEGANQSVTVNGACSDIAGNLALFTVVGNINIDKSAPFVSITGVSEGGSYIVGSVPVAGCSTSDALSGVVTQAVLNLTGGNPDGTGSFTATCSGASDVAGNSAVPVSVNYTVTAVVSDSCTTVGLLDNFNRANGGLGSQWAGATSQSFYKVANNQVDVQLGGPVAWKPTIFGPNQAVFVTLSTLDGASLSQGVLLKVQSGTLPNAGAIAVVYDSLAQAVRVSTLRLNTPTWTPYPNTPVTFANGDKLGGCVKADGRVRIYKNNSLLTTVTLNAADQSFFNAKGGKIGLWTLAAPNAFLDDFGGGALDGFSTAAVDEATDTVTDDATATPGALINRVFLPQVSR